MVVGCQPYSPVAFTPRKNSWYSFLLEAESTPGPQCDRKDFMSTKNPLTPAGIEPPTYRFVAQHVNDSQPSTLLIKQNPSLKKILNLLLNVFSNINCNTTQQYTFWLQSFRKTSIHPSIGYVVFLKGRF